MRTRNPVPRDQLVAVLRRAAAVSAPDLAAQLGVGVATLHRMLQEIPERVVATGKARRTRYALRRPLRGDLSELPLYEVDAEGRAQHTGQLARTYPQGSCIDIAAAGWPVPDESRDGWWGGLPYPLYDMRPQGFMGRQFARAQHRALEVPPDPRDWSDEDILHVLVRAGSDTSGNLILGNPAYEQWMAHKLAPPEPVKPRALGRAYAARAEQALAAGVAGSSAAGEFPKFPALRERAGSATPRVLVKFSGADDSAAVRRWSDLLVCEHLALECLATMPGASAACSRIVLHAGRTFLEVERFDRHGFFGRSRLSSLATLDPALIGSGTTDWTRIATRLLAAGLLSKDDDLRIQHLWWFGRLIANTDMHTGNLSFGAHRHAHTQLTLAPAYDMLPMLYAPLPGGEVPARRFEPPLPLPPQRPVWQVAFDAALLFWQRAAADARIGESFRQIADANAQRLQHVADKV